MLSHTGSSPGRAFSCCLLGRNNYSISRQCVPLIVLLGCRCRGPAAESLEERKGGGCHSQDSGREEYRVECLGLGGWGLKPTQSCPEEPRAGLMSSGWPIRKLLLTRTCMDLLPPCPPPPLPALFSSSAAFTSPGNLLALHISHLLISISCFPLFHSHYILNIDSLLLILPVFL